MRSFRMQIFLLLCPYYNGRWTVFPVFFMVIPYKNDPSKKNEKQQKIPSQSLNDCVSLYQIRTDCHDNEG